MALEYLTLSKVMVSLLGATALVGSGAGLASHLKSSGRTIVLEQEQHKDTAQRRNTKLRKHGNTSLYLEYSHLDEEQKYYIYDPLLDQESAYVYYLVNADERIIRLSPTTLPSKHQGIYGGWILHQFKHPNFKTTFYGYCHPKGGECNHLPKDWTKEPL